MMKINPMTTLASVILYPFIKTSVKVFIGIYVGSMYVKIFKIGWKDSTGLK